MLAYAALKAIRVVFSLVTLPANLSFELLKRRIRRGVSTGWSTLLTPPPVNYRPAIEGASPCSCLVRARMPYLVQVYGAFRVMLKLRTLQQASICSQEISDRGGSQVRLISEYEFLVPNPLFSACSLLSQKLNVPHKKAPRTTE